MKTGINSYKIPAQMAPPPFINPLMVATLDFPLIYIYLPKSAYFFKKKSLKNYILPINFY